MSRLLAARDQVYAHFQLQAECASIQNRKDSRKLPGQQNKPLEQLPTGNEKKGQPNASDDDKKGPNVKESPKNGAETNGDLESQPLGKPLYVTEGLKRRIFPEFFKRMNQLFSDARSRRALVCASTAMISQQLCGVNTIGKH